MILHFERRLQEKDFADLAAKGIHVWNYLDGNAYTATVDLDNTDKLLEATKDINKVTSYEIIQGRHKVEPLPPTARSVARYRSVTPGRAAESATTSAVYTVELWPDANIEQAKTELGAIGQVGSSNEYTKRLDITLPSADQISKVTANRFVKFVSPKPVPAIQNTHIRRNLNVDAVQSGNGSVTGANVKVAIFDQGHVAKDHPSFKGRLIFDKAGDEGTVYSPQAHATHVAGTIAASGDYQAPLTSSTGGGSITEQSLPAFGDILESTMSTNATGPSATFAEPSYPGVAPGAQIVSYDFHDTDSKLVNVLVRTPQTIDVASNSWTDVDLSDCASFKSYNDNARLFDQISSGHVAGGAIKRVPIVFAAGNYRSQHIDNKFGSHSTAPMICGFSSIPPFLNYRTVTPPGTAKNVITVGAIDADNDCANNCMTEFSGFGPAPDGRVKPEIVAPGCRTPGIVSAIPQTSVGTFCGTSQAAPAVSGLIALMMQKIQDMGVDKSGIYPSTYKAVLIHAAEDLGKPGPDFAYGYGRVRAPETIALVANRSFSQASTSREGEIASRTITVPAGAKEIKVTLAWDDPPRSSFGILGGLSNDLDLSLKSPTQEVFLPWVLNTAKGREGDAATRGLDHTNVVEQVSVKNPAAGDWQIDVKASTLGDVRFSQTYSLVTTVE